LCKIYADLICMHITPLHRNIFSWPCSLCDCLHRRF
jgi:hypothetical protein